MANKKDQVLVGDLVFINQHAMPVALAVVKGIQPDGKQRDWWHVKFVRNVDGLVGEWTWLLDGDHLAGEEFTLAGISYTISIIKRAKVGDVAEAEPEVKSQIPSSNRGNVLF